MRLMTIVQLETFMRPVVMDGKINYGAIKESKGEAINDVVARICGSNDKPSDVDNHMHYYASLMIAEGTMETYLRAQADELIPPKLRNNDNNVDKNILEEYNACIAEADDCHRREAIYRAASTICKYWMITKGYLSSEYNVADRKSVV